MLIEGSKQKSGGVGKKSVVEIWGAEDNEQDLKRGKDGAWEGEDGAELGGKTRERIETHPHVLCQLTGHCGSSPRPAPAEAVQSLLQHVGSAVTPGAAASSRKRAEHCRHSTSPSLPRAGTGLRALTRELLLQTTPGHRFGHRFLLSRVGRQAPGLRALSEERLQTPVRAGSSWASYLVKHAKDFSQIKKTGASLGRRFRLRVHVNEKHPESTALETKCPKAQNHRGETESAGMAAGSYRCLLPAVPGAPQRGERGARCLRHRNRGSGKEQSGAARGLAAKGSLKIVIPLSSRNPQPSSSKHKHGAMSAH